MNEREKEKVGDCESEWESVNEWETARGGDQETD